MSGRIELIEGPRVPSVGLLVAGGVVVFAGQLHRAGARAVTRAICQCPAQAFTVVGAKRSALHRHLDAVVEPRRQLAGDAHADRRLRQVADVASSLRRFTSRRQKRYGSTAACGITFADAAYTPANRLPLPLLSNSSGRMRTSDAPKTSACNAFVRRMTRAASNVRPVFTQREVPEQPLLAERQLLPAQSRGDAGLGVADVGKTRAEIERTAERAPLSDRLSFSATRASCTLRLKRRGASRR